MTYEENRNTLNTNLKIGLIASLVFHTLIVSLSLFINDENIVQFKEGFIPSNSIDLKLADLKAENYEIRKFGGGGTGGGTNLSDGGPAKDISGGIPVPSAKPDNVQFDFLSLSAKDSLNKNMNLKQGIGLGTGEGSGTGSGKGAGHGAGSGDGTSIIPFTPRQILEVIPENRGDFNGLIKLSVRIGKDGLVKDHKIIQNSTGSSACLVKVLEAVYKSKWQSVKIEGKVVEYWTEKSYRFE